MIRFRVADHVFGLTMSQMCRPIPVMGNYRPFIDKSDEQPLFTVALDREVVGRVDQPSITFDYDLQEGDCTLRIYDDEYRLTIRSRGHEATLVCPLLSEGEVAEYYADIFVEGRTSSTVIFDHAMVFAYSFATLPHKTLLIHSSVITKDQRAVMCLGESGTGKSTHTRLWLENISETERLNDDGPVVRVMNDGSVRVYGSPWSGKGCVWKQQWCPIAGFLRLSQAPVNEITKLGKVGGFGALLPSTLPTLQQEERMLDQICSTLSDVLAVTNTYRMACLPDVAAAELSYRTIYGLTTQP